MITSFQGRYRFLSNFYLSPVRWGGIVYPTVEHAYQALKTGDYEERARVAALTTPGEAKRAGRAFHLPANWESTKVDKMEHLLYRKFTKYELRKLLLETGNEGLVEGNTWGDTFWGVYRGSGRNMLGRLLMRIRKRVAGDLT